MSAHAPKAVLKLFLDANREEIETAAKAAVPGSHPRGLTKAQKQWAESFAEAQFNALDLREWSTVQCFRSA